MYLAVVLLLMAVLPLLSIAAEALVLNTGSDIIDLVGRWFVFWAVGVRLFLAGLRQTSNPAYTAKGIFGIDDPAAHKLVQEIGFGNLAIGLLGLIAGIHAAWIAPAAIAGGLFYGLAGIRHAANRGRNQVENIAMISDLLAVALLTAHLAIVAVRSFA